MGGEYFTLKPGAELPGDQRSDDGGSVTFETEPLGEAVELLGRPVMQVTLRCAAATALLAARLVDVHPDGTATRRSEEHTSALQSLMRYSYAVFCLKKNTSLQHVDT